MWLKDPDKFRDLKKSAKDYAFQNYAVSQEILSFRNLIEKVNISNNGLVYYFTLKQDIRFNNGTSLNSEDVVSSLGLLNTILKDTEIYKNFFILNSELIVESIAFDKFKISVDVPNGNLFYALSNFPIIPKKTAEIISEDIEVFIDYWEIKSNMDIFGSGPYKIDEINEGI